jgi:hypothetical protein
MATNYPYPGSSSASFAPREEHRPEPREETSNYSLAALRQFMSRKRLFIKAQFVTSDDTVAFVKVHVESIGENILVYFPSKYVVPREEGSIPAFDIVPYDLTDEDMAALNSAEEQENKDAYAELVIDDLKDRDSFASDSYRPISLENNKEHQVRKALAGYHNQLDKFRRATTHIKYKFAIMTNSVLSVISRHNETESYLIKTQATLVPPVVDSKTETVVPIAHQLYIVVDLPSFFEKMDQVAGDIITVYRNWYAMLSRAHTKQTAMAEQRFKNYQLLIGRLIGEYNKNAKFLDLIASLTTSLEKSVEQETQLLQKLDLVQRGQDGSMSKDESRSFKLDKIETDLAKVREVKTKTTTLLQEIKARYNAFLLTFDAAISVVCKNLREIERVMGDLGLRISDKRK